MMTSEHKFTAFISILAAAASLLGAAIGGLVTYEATKSQEENQNSAAAEATLQSRVSSLLAVSLQVQQLAVEEPTDANEQKLGDLTVSVSRDYLVVLLSAQEPITRDANRLIEADTALESFYASRDGSGIEKGWLNIAKAVTQLEDDMNPHLGISPNDIKIGNPPGAD